MGGVRFNEEQTQLLEKILDKLLEVKEIVKGMQVNCKRLQQSYKEEENGPIAEDEIVQEEKKNAALQICFHDQATESGGKEESVVTEESLIFNGEISETLVETGDLSPVSKGADSHHSGDIPEEFLTAQQLSALQEENEQARNNFPRPSLKKKQREDCENEVKSVSWNASGTLLAVCGRDESVWIWEMQPANELECISVLQGHIPDVKMIQWQPTTDVWFACSYDNTIKTWTDEAETIEEFGDTLSEEQIWGHLDRGREGKCESILIIHKVFLNVYGKMGRPWNKTLNFVEMSMYTSAAGSNFELLGHFSGVGSFNRMVSKAIQGNGEGRKQEFYKWERDFNLNKSLMFGVPVTPIIESLLQFKYHALTIYGLLRHWVAHPLCYRNIIPAVLDCLDVVYEIMNSRRSFRALQNVQVFCNGDLMKFENSCNKGRRAPHNPINKVVPENGLKFSLSSSRATGSPYEDEDEMVFWMVKGMKVMFIYSQIQEKPLPYYSLSAMNLVDKVLLRRGECYDPPRQ